MEQTRYSFQVLLPLLLIQATLILSLFNARSGLEACDNYLVGLQRKDGFSYDDIYSLAIVLYLFNAGIYAMSSICFFFKLLWFLIFSYLNLSFLRFLCYIVYNQNSGMLPLAKCYSLRNSFCYEVTALIELDPSNKYFRFDCLRLESICESTFLQCLFFSSTIAMISLMLCCDGSFWRDERRGYENFTSVYCDIQQIQGRSTITAITPPLLLHLQALHAKDLNIVA